MSNQGEAVAGSIEHLLASGDDEALIWVCRDIEGPHAGGPECFCNPRGFTVDELDGGLPAAYNEVN